MEYYPQPGKYTPATAFHDTMLLICDSSFTARKAPVRQRAKHHTIRPFLWGSPTAPRDFSLVRWGQFYFSPLVGCQPKNRGVYPPKWMVKIMGNPYQNG